MGIKMEFLVGKSESGRAPWRQKWREVAHCKQLHMFSSCTPGQKLPEEGCFSIPLLVNEQASL